MDVFYDQEADRRTHRRYFHLCHFKGGSKTTVNNTSTYTPTEYELAMQKQAADYAKAVSPNALALNNYAMNVLRDSLGTVQVDYNGMNKAAQGNLSNAMNGMYGLIGSNNAAVNAANNSIGGLSGQYQRAANSANNDINRMEGTYNAAAGNANRSLNSILNNYNSALQGANRTLGNTMNGYQQALGTVNQAIGNNANNFSEAVQGTNSTLGNVASTYNAATNKVNGSLNNVLGNYSASTNKANSILGNSAGATRRIRPCRALAIRCPALLMGTSRQRIKRICRTPFPARSPIRWVRHLPIWAIVAY